MASVMAKYKKRICDGLLSRKLAGVGAVLLEGPKWCGKTTTCERLARSVLYMGDPETREKTRQIASIDINALLAGARPRLIDEWQEVPRLWDAIRFKVDHAEGFGHFILTGSAVPPAVAEMVHSGTGRIVRVKMRPMSLWESQESSGIVSLGALMDGLVFDVVACEDRKLADVAYLVCRGGWPRAVEQGGDMALERAEEYYDATIDADISRVDRIPRDPERVMRLMRSYARLQATQAKFTAIKQDMQEHDSATGLSPNGKTAGEATPRRAVADVPVHAGVAARRCFRAWRLQRQDHLARFFRLPVRSVEAVPPAMAREERPEAVRDGVEEEVRHVEHPL